MKYYLAIAVLLITAFVITGCFGVAEETNVQNEYDWTTPGGTIIRFKTENFPGVFYPERIERILAPYCQESLVVDEVIVTITDALGYNGKNPVSYEAGYGVTAVVWENKNIANISVYIAGGGFQKLAELMNTYEYPARSGAVVTTAILDLSGTIVEEVGVHVCRRTAHEDFPLSENRESEDIHRKFLLKPVILFKPDW